MHPSPPAASPARRRWLAASLASVGLAASGCATARPPTGAWDDVAPAADWRDPTIPTIDLHSHGGHIIVAKDPAMGANRPFVPLAAPMRAGRLDIVCLAIVTDTVVTHIDTVSHRIEAVREPNPGELWALGQAEFDRAKRLIDGQGLARVTDRASLATQVGAGPAVLLASEGADFLEGRLERVDEAFEVHGLRQLQLVHYRVNELGDIQTELPVHGDITPFGADVVRRCNALGIAVDVAHARYEMVKRVADLATKPLILSHTALSAKPGPKSRLISPDHARVVASTGGVIGVWPSSGSFKDLDAMALGMKRMADVVGVEHVGLGTDLYGFPTPPVFTAYEQLPLLAAALSTAGFARGEVAAILGGNARRVFEASLR